MTVHGELRGEVVASARILGKGPPGGGWAGRVHPDTTSLQTCATRKHAMKPMARGSSEDTVVHFALRVSYPSDAHLAPGEPYRVSSLYFQAWIEAPR